MFPTHAEGTSIDAPLTAVDARRRRTKESIVFALQTSHRIITTGVGTTKASFRVCAAVDERCILRGVYFFLIFFPPVDRLLSYLEIRCRALQFSRVFNLSRLFLASCLISGTRCAACDASRPGNGRTDALRHGAVVPRASTAVGTSTQTSQRWASWMAGTVRGHERAHAPVHACGHAA